MGGTYDITVIECLAHERMSETNMIRELDQPQSWQECKATYKSCYCCSDDSA